MLVMQVIVAELALQLALITVKKVVTNLIVWEVAQLAAIQLVLVAVKAVLGLVLEDAKELVKVDVVVSVAVVVAQQFVLIKYVQGMYKNEY